MDSNRVTSNHLDAVADIPLAHWTAMEHLALAMRHSRELCRRFGHVFHPTQPCLRCRAPQDISKAEP